MLTVRPGDVFVHPSGARVVVVTASEDRLEADLTLPPKTGRLPEHVHAMQVETFQIQSGSGPYRLNGADKRATAGEGIEIPAGARHVNPWNDGATDLVYRQTISPVLDFMDIVTKRLGFRKR